MAQAGPGPLTQAASAARVAAEARIKAALHERRSPASGGNPYPGTDPDLARQAQAADPGAFDLPGAALPGAALPGAALPGATVPGAVLPGAVLPGAAAGWAGPPRPEAASGAIARPAATSPEIHPSQQPDSGSDWAGQEPGVLAEIGQPAVAAFRPQPELAAYLDAGPEPDPFFDRQEDSAAASLLKRSRMARGHVIPRLPRARRPGAAPGA